MTIEYRRNGLLIRASSTGELSTGLLNAHSAIAAEQIRSEMIMRVALYCLAGFFFVAGSILLTFGPQDRPAAFWLAVILFALSCVAGFSAFSVRLPLIEIEASTKD